ncbi:MAG: Rpn family recombination-promoting nuclease/putative transposase [Lysinibacillus sp.]
MHSFLKWYIGSERNKHITIVFLNAILQRTGRDTIKEVIFANQEVGGEYEDDKQSRLDIVVKTRAGELINVEMQLNNRRDMFRRSLYYWSRLFNSQLQKGYGYRTLVPTITINICDFTLFDEINHYHSTYHLYEDSTLQRLNKADDVLEIHFIEMNKFLKAWHADQLNPLDDILASWLLLLGMVDAKKRKVYDDIYKELEELAMRDENLREAFDVWEEISQTPETILAYQSRLKYIIDEEAKLADAKLEGKEEGREEGIEQGMEKGIVKGREEGRVKGKEEVVMIMIAKGKSNEEIKELTGLTLDEVNTLRTKV